MAEIVDLDSYRRQRKRRLMEANTAANRRGGKRSRPEHGYGRPAAEPVDIGRRRIEPTEAKPDGKTSE